MDADEFSKNVKLYLEGDKSKLGDINLFYYEKVFPGVLSHFLETAESKKIISSGKYKYIISIVGFSAPPIIFWNRIIKPIKHFFICSPETEKTIDRVIKELGNLLPSHFDKKVVQSTKILDIHYSLKEILSAIGKEHWREVLIDITGGKKSMVGAAATIGEYLGIDMGYIDYKKYNVEMRKPEPGTEFPIILDNPLEVFSDVEIDRSKAFFNSNHFERANEVFKELLSKTRNMREVETYMEINNIYKLWNDFDIAGAISKADNFLQKVNSNTYVVENNLKERMAAHLELLKDIKKGFDGIPEFEFYVPLNFYFAAERYAKTKKFDIAVFLMYRSLESIEQIRIKRHGIKHSNARREDYTKAGITKEKYFEAARKVYKAHFVPPSNLPRKVALMDGYIILGVLNDEVAKVLPLTDILSVVQRRNNSIYTHGISPLQKGDYESIRRVGRILLNAFLKAENKEQNYRIFEDEFLFPKL